MKCFSGRLFELFSQRVFFGGFEIFLGPKRADFKPAMRVHFRAAIARKYKDFRANSQKNLNVVISTGIPYMVL